MPFFYALVDPTETTFEVAHQRVDIEFISWEMIHSEGDFASFTGVAKNERIGLMAPGRKIWLWVAWDNGTSVIPIFFGRLVGIPSDLLQETWTLEFIARPVDYSTIKHHVAQALKTAPFYDPIFLKVENRDAPDPIMEARPESWHIGRVDHAVTTSDWLNGEDGVVSFGESEIVYDSLRMTQKQGGRKRIAVEATVTWANASSGYIDFGDRSILTYAGQSLISEHPQIGVGLGGGWSVFHSAAHDDYGISTLTEMTSSFNYQNRAASHNPGDTMNMAIRLTQPAINTPFIQARLTQFVDNAVIDPFNADFQDDPQGGVRFTDLILPLWSVSTSLVLRYDAGRTRTEKIKFTVNANLQAVITDDGDSPATAPDEVLTIDGEDVGLAIQSADFISGEALAAEPPPIGDASRNTYFNTDRGKQSVEYLIARAVAPLIYDARAVELSFDCSFAKAIDLSCRKNALVTDRRIFGGSAIGKIISYKFAVSGPEGSLLASVTVGCPIGYGGHAATEEGENAYIDDDYIDPDYYEREGELIALGDVPSIVYPPPTAPVTDSGKVFPLTASQVILRDEIIGSRVAQEAAINAILPDVIRAAQLGGIENKTAEQQIEANALARDPLAAVLQDNPVYRHLELESVDGEELQGAYELGNLTLFVPMGINTEAPSA